MSSSLVQRLIERDSNVNEEEWERKSREKREWAQYILQAAFEKSKPRRFIAGIAVSSKLPSLNGETLIAAGCAFMGAEPLMLEHEKLQPLGWVRKVEPVGSFLRFVAEIANSGRSWWIEQAWDGLARGTLRGVSVGPSWGKARSAEDRTFEEWGLGEVSLTNSPADLGARVCRVWEDSGVVYVDPGRSGVRVLFDEQAREEV